MLHATHAGSVFGGPVAAVLVSSLLAPTIVDDYFVFHGRFVEEPGEEFGTVPFTRRDLPLAIAEDDGGFVTSDEVFELREHVIFDIAGLIIEPQRVVPLIERIVDSHAEAFAANGVCEIAQ
jgi:hypothetical protein